MLWVVLFATGCQTAIVGHWVGVRSTNNREMFFINDLTFANDRTYAATLTLEGRHFAERGTFAFNGRKLRLYPAAGGKRAYSARLKLRTLSIEYDRHRVTLRKQRRPASDQTTKEKRE